MAILSYEDFMERIKSRVGDDSSDEAISFIEDMNDTIKDRETRLANSDADEWKKKYEENDKMWREKYKSTFFNGVTAEEIKKAQEEQVKDDGEKRTFSELFTEREGN